MKIRIIMPLVIGILFIGTAIAPFLGTNVTNQDFGIEFEEEIALSEEGTAKRILNKGTYSLEIETALENPTEEYYAVWLIRLSPFTNLNLGNLEDGYFKYTEENTTTDYKTFTEIIITLESTPDAKIPDENHILEASF